MKYFDKDFRYNFVDDNNVFVGYDNSPDCCEDFGFFYSLEEVNEPNQNKFEPTEEFLEEYSFDTYYFKAIEGGMHFDSGGMVTFRLMNKSRDKQLFLNLYNCQNGYYSHGFELKIGDRIMRSDSI